MYIEVFSIKPKMRTTLDTTFLLTQKYRLQTFTASPKALFQRQFHEIYRWFDWKINSYTLYNKWTLTCKFSVDKNIFPCQVLFWLWAKDCGGGFFWLHISVRLPSKKFCVTISSWSILDNNIQTRERRPGCKDRMEKSNRRLTPVVKMSTGLCAHDDPWETFWWDFAEVEFPALILSFGTRRWISVPACCCCSRGSPDLRKRKTVQKCARLRLISVSDTC